MLFGVLLYSSCQESGRSSTPTDSSAQYLEIPSLANNDNERVNYGDSLALEDGHGYGRGDVQVTTKSSAVQGVICYQSMHTEG